MTILNWLSSHLAYFELFCHSPVYFCTHSRTLPHAPHAQVSTGEWQELIQSTSIVNWLSSYLTYFELTQTATTISFQETVKLFKSRYNYVLTIPERMQFISPWHVQIIITDALIITACSSKFYLRFGVSQHNVIYPTRSVKTSLVQSLTSESLRKYLQSGSALKLNVKPSSISHC